MEEKTTPVEVLLERAQAYTKTSIKLFKYKATDRLAEMLSNLASRVIIIAVFVLFFVNLNIGIALLVGEMLGKTWLGFVLIAAFYALLGFFIFLFRDRLIKTPVSNSIITQLLSDEIDHDQKMAE